MKITKVTSIQFHHKYYPFNNNTNFTLKSLELYILLVFCLCNPAGDFVKQPSVPPHF